MRIGLLCATRRGYKVLSELLALTPKHDYVVFSFPETPGEPLYFEDIRQLALSVNANFFSTKKLTDSVTQEFLHAHPPDILLVVNWRSILPPDVYSQPILGTWVFHDSLLPQYRGFSPTVWAIANGESKTGVSLFRIHQEMDAGEILDQESVGIGPDDTIAAVQQNVTDAYLAVLKRNIGNLLAGNVHCVPQNHLVATYVCKRTEMDNRVNWKAPSQQIYNLIRAVTSPYPGAFTFLNGKRLVIWKASISANSRTYCSYAPGRVVEIHEDESVAVLCGSGTVNLQEVQLENGGRISAAQVLDKLSYNLD